MSSPNKSISSFLQQIKTDYSSLSFVESDHSRWDPSSSTVFYKSTESENPIWSIMHELGHMEAEHKTYKSDVQLLHMELEAWQIAKRLGDDYDHPVDNSYIEDCMDSYRDWLHKRSTCPTCKQTGVENNKGHYSCLNCSNKWTVGESRFCRVYRKSKNTT